MHVIIADDDAVTRLFVEKAVANAGHQVDAVEDGEEAWGLFQLSKVDVMIVDGMMPRVDGFEVCRRVRDANRDDYTYLIMLTSLKGSDDFLAAIDAGADDFVTKPVGGRELVARLRVAERTIGLQAHVRRLEGLLPICAWCKKIRSDADAWQEIDSYMSEHADTTFTHGICPSCAEKHLKA